ncbi:MAG: periplasmic heavy metal sensor [Bacteroidota bacterium]
MNNISRQKWMLPLLLILVVANLATLVYLWLPAKKQPGLPNRNGFDLLVKELQMTEAQQATYTKLRDEHQRIVRPLREQIRNAKDDLFELLDNDTVSQTVVEAAAAKPALIQQQMDMASFQHFKKLRAICTPAQQLKFDDIIQDVIRQMGLPPGGRPNGPPPPHGPGERPDGPPHPDGPPGDRPDGPPPPHE